MTDTRVLLTTHGTVLCRGPGGAIVQRGPDGLGDDALTLDALAAASVQVAPGGAQGLLALARDGHCLRADPDRRTTAFDRDAARAHERFLPLGDADRVLLAGLLHHDWLRRSTGEVLPAGAVRLGAGFTLQVGAMQLDLRAQLPFLGRALPHRVTILEDGWQPDELCLYRPLVAFAAFRSPAVLGQLAIALRSLLTLGAYRGEILVLTDRPREEILAAVPELAPGQLRVEPVRVGDRVGCIAVRYVLADLPGLHRHQPILYADTDIVFDAPVAPTLHAAATADAIVAPLEDHVTIAGSTSAGGDLIGAEDALAADAGMTPGFNAGTLGIPNLAQHADTLRLVRRLVVNRTDLVGRTRLGWVDQPLANYVRWRHGGFETHAISGFMRWGLPKLDARAPARRGMVHFWVDRSAEHKREAMDAYFSAIAPARDPDRQESRDVRTT